MTNDRRLIEDDLSNEAISKETTREKSVRKGHISTLPQWRLDHAEREIVASRFFEIPADAVVAVGRQWEAKG
jgi:putative DNA methylase